ncbi:MAG: hypothetical protein LBR10_14935 [Prevotellaceae bacterium]|jgi:hypothetical protein|nr:hypothetical protein [Prevotellaceae bacterium]
MRLIKPLLLSVFRKKKNKVMIANFIDSALIIDDTPREVIGLRQILHSNGISVSFYTPNSIAKCTTKLKNRKIIFLDLYLTDDPKIEGNISKIRKIFETNLGNNFGSYGIVLWSAHTDEIEELQKRINNDQGKYTLPLFIIGLEKIKYTKSNNYSNLFDDINKELENNSAATFFLEWSNSVQQAQNTTISNIYSLLPNYTTSSDDFTFILKELAKNHTGIPEGQVGNYPSLYIDAYKSFDDILHAELINCQKSGIDIFSKQINPFSKQDELTNIFSQLNAAMFIDTNNIVQNIVIPGNIYKTITDNELLKIDGAPKKAAKIVIEITPPCDFSQKKNGNPRIVSGFMFDWSDEKEKQEKYLKSFGGDARYIIYPIKITNISNPQFICFDFRYTTAIKKQDLQDASKYQILFRAKPKLFADVLQKFSAHAARLGLSVIHS